MNIGRLFRHFTLFQWQVRRAFPRESLAQLEQAIAASEKNHAGQICLAIEGALDGLPLLKDQTARERALEVFSHLRVWDTEHNNGVLIYLLLADRDVEIVADRGISSRATVEEWESICRQMEDRFKHQHYAEGIADGIEQVSVILSQHFPRENAGKNELADRPTML